MLQRRRAMRRGAWLRLVGAVLAATATAMTWSTSAAAQQEPPPADDETAVDSTSRDFPALFVGFETEPAMDYGGRVVAAAQDAVAASFAGIGDAGKRHPGLAPVWEFPTAAALLLVEHEVLGHGGRAREFGLSPSYSFGLDFSGGTS